MRGNGEPGAGRRRRTAEAAAGGLFCPEELAVANAVPTAEGAIQIALEELPITLHGARALVIGYGRLGKALAQRLDGLGARVTVAARSWEALAWAQSRGAGYRTRRPADALAVQL